MKTISYSLKATASFFSIVLPAFLALVGCQKNEATSLLIPLENKLAVRVSDAPVTLSRETVVEKMGELAYGKVVVVKIDTRILPSQMDDLDGDGEWDELAFVCDLAPGTFTEVSLSLADYSMAEAYQPRTNLHFFLEEQLFEETRLRGDPRKPYQMEGPAWENDKLGFRIYFDERNGKDIFGKKVSHMTLDATGINEDYHTLQNWGMDVLKVGESLGAGSLAIVNDDLLVRLGEVDEVTYKLLAEGPVRSVFSLSYKGWEVGSEKLDLTEIITIWAGRYWFQSQVSIAGTDQPKQVVVGMVNKFGLAPVQEQVNGMAMLATHGIQSENKDALGMAIMVSSSNFHSFGSRPANVAGISETEYISFVVSPGKQTSYFFMAGWGLSAPAFAQDTSFFEAVRDEALRIDLFNLPL